VEDLQDDRYIVIDPTTGQIDYERTFYRCKELLASEKLTAILKIDQLFKEKEAINEELSAAYLQNRRLTDIILNSNNQLQISAMCADKSDAPKPDDTTKQTPPTATKKMAEPAKSAKSGKKAKKYKRDNHPVRTAEAPEIETKAPDVSLFSIYLRYV
jgi:hypothetical protein